MTKLKRMKLLNFL